MGAGRLAGHPGPRTTGRDCQRWALQLLVGDHVLAVPADGLFSYYFQDEYTPEPEIERAAKPYMEGAEWQVGDLLGAWKIDSPEPVKMVSEQGVTEITSLELSLRQYRSDRNPSAEVPETCQVYWRIESKEGQELFMDASTGEILE